MNNPSPPIVLLAFANDADAPLRELALEQDELKEVFAHARTSGKCELITLAAASPDKIIQVFQRHPGRIRVFHYGGHSNEDKLFLRKDFPTQDATQATQLAGFLATQKALELVFLNGCLNFQQAANYHAAGVKALIATHHAIGDRSAREFARLFYQSLAGGATIGDSFAAAEKAFVLKLGERQRGISWEGKEENAFPWQLFPEGPHAWRLPLVARHLATIPSLDLEKDFVGRESELEALHTELERTPNPVVVKGVGGIGKTVFVMAYLALYGQHYQHLLWINRGEDLVQSVALNLELADNLEIALKEGEEMESRFARIMAKLRMLAGKNLLVIDNAGDELEAKGLYEQLPHSANWQILLTSRHQLSGFDTFSLRSLKEKTAVQLFQSHYQEYLDPNELSELLQEIDFHTLTVELLAKLLDKLNGLISVGELTEMLRKQQLDDPGLQEEIWARHSKEEQGIYFHLMQAFELAKLNKNEKYLLNQFVVLPAQRYSVKVFAKAIDHKPLTINKYLNSLADHGWLTRHEDKTVSMHRLLRQVVQYQLKPGWDDVKRLVAVLSQKILSKEHENPILKCGPWIDLAVEVEHFVSHRVDPVVALLQNNIAVFYGYLGRKRQALDYAHKYLTVQETLLEADDPGLGIAYNNIAASYHEIGEHEKALQYVQKALEIREKGLSPNDHDLANTYNTLAGIQKGLKQYDEALQSYGKARKIWESIFESDHPVLASCYSNIGDLYYKLDDNDQAEDYLQRALAIREARLDVQHPDLAKSYYNLAGLYEFRQEYQNALQNAQKALSIRETILDEEHPDLASAYARIGSILYLWDQDEKAIGYLKKALLIRKVILGPYDSELGITYHDLGIAYLSCRQYQEALHCFEKSLPIWEDSLPADHVKLGITHVGIGRALNKLNRPEEAIQSLEKALKILEGNADYKPESLRQAYSGMRTVYEKRGDREKELHFFHKELAIEEGLLSADDPELGVSYNNLGTVYYNLQQYESALKYYLLAETIMDKSPDRFDLSKGTTCRNICFTLYRQQEYERALGYFHKLTAIREKEWAADDKRWVELWGNMARVLEKLGREEEAKDYLSQVETIKNKTEDYDNGA